MMQYRESHFEPFDDFTATSAGEALLTSFNHVLHQASRPQDKLDWLMLRTGDDEGLGELVEIPTNHDAMVCSSFQNHDDRIWTMPYDQPGMLMIVDTAAGTGTDLIESLLTVCEAVDETDDVDWVMLQRDQQIWLLVFATAISPLKRQFRELMIANDDCELEAVVSVNVVASGFQMD
ncbi:hypothetical protein [Secundilactobacillus kimchicus]|uniref:Uncharacterized protein n=1 Tax=Secundilactobacillus kimchicus JCM 15530 TaxID=1302272 RepID=A0A0R1HK97_9LACO|nr:hypothetical protein [Secundilactobacillus kimchicus]KRK46940.1 hypothetical protein FC96_GL000831 [Secundilactobacillus kimchicus JCM 15530]